MPGRARLALSEEMDEREIAVDQPMLHLDPGIGPGDHRRQRHQRKTKDGREMLHSAPSFISDTAWSQARAVSAI